MAVTVSAKNYTLIDDCEAVGSWIGENPAVVSDFYKEGSNCLGFTIRGAGNQDTYRTGSWDLSGTKHFRWWFMTVALKELNWIQLYVSDGTNTGYYDVLAIADYPGGWFNIVIDLSRAVDAGTKPNMAAVTTIGFRYNNSAIGKNAQNTWIDHLCICDGLVAYGDDAGGYFDFADILSADEDTTNGWGIIRNIGGVYFLVGSLEFGDGSGTASCKFQDKSQVVIFEDRKVNSSLYSFDVVDNGTGTTEFILGDKVGSAGIQGCVVRVEDLAQSAKFDVDGSTDTDVDNFKLYGSVFLGAGAITFPGAALNVEVLNCSFESCGQVDPDDASVSECFFISTTDVDAALLWNESIDINNCSFIGNTTGAGIEMPSAVGSPYAYDALFFSGNTYDVLNSSGSAISINKNNGSDPTTYEGSAVTFLSGAVSATQKVTTTLGVDIQNARVFLKASNGTGPFPFEESVTITRSGTTASVAHTAHGMANGDKVVIEGADQNEYNGVRTISNVTTNAYDYTVSGAPDSPATGTITSTFVALEGLTDVNGEITMSRIFSSDQPVVGWARKSTSSPFYKSGAITGTIDDINGYTGSVALVLDE